MAEPDPDALGEIAAQDRILPPPDARPDPRFYQWAGVSHLFDPATYRDLPPPSIAPNEQGKVPQSDPRVLGGLADLTNVVQNFMPLGGSAVGAAKAAVPLLGSLARGAAREAPAAESALAQGIRAYHSSPYDFDKFDLSKIGTGEGAQVYGHGLYFAENPAVSGQGGQYWQQFANRFRGPESSAANILKLKNFDRDAAIDFARQSLAREEKALRVGRYVPGDPATTMSAEQRSWHPALIDKRREVLQLLESGKPVGPRTYEVNINAHPDQLLDYDRSLNEQSGHVKSTLGGLGIEDTGGQSLVNYLAEKFGGSSRSSQSLRDAGIPGIRYLDQGSRVTNPDALRIVEAQGSREAARAVAEKRLKSASAGDLRYWDNIVKQLQPESSNYVIFDPNRIDILRKYGVVGAAPAAAGAMGELVRQEQ
jgi:hypothetical protein